MHLHNKATLGYYPTPDLMVQAIASWISVHNPMGYVNMIDNCAGKGKALALLKTLLLERHPDLAITTYGVELDSQRGYAARKNLDHVIVANALEKVVITSPDDAPQFQLWFCNPPYSQDGKSRIEQRFLLNGTVEHPILVAGGLLVFIVQRQHLEVFADTLVKYYDIKHTINNQSSYTVRRFTDVEQLYEQFQQCIIFATRRVEPLPVVKDDPAYQELIRFATVDQDDADAWATCKALGLCNPLVPQSARILLPSADTTKELRFTIKLIDMYEAFTQIYATGIASSPNFVEQLVKPSMKVQLTPLRNLQEGHTTRLLAAGIMGNELLAGTCSNPYDHSQCHHPLIIRGDTQRAEVCKSVDIQEKEKTDTSPETSYERQTNITVYLIKINALDLITGEFHILSTDTLIHQSSRWKTPESFLYDYRNELRDMAEQHYPPRYNNATIGTDKWPTQDFTDIIRPPFDAQKLMIEVGAAELRRGVAMINCGEMGTGKTYQSICTAYFAAKDDLHACTLIFVPPTLPDQWKAELENTVPDANPLFGGKGYEGTRGVFIVESITDLYKPDFLRARYVIIGYSAAKLNSSLRVAVEQKWYAYRDAVLNKVKVLPRWYCPTCGAEVLDKNNKSFYNVKDIMTQNHLVCRAERTRKVVNIQGEGKVRGGYIGKTSIMLHDQEVLTNHGFLTYNQEILLDKNGEPVPCGTRLFQPAALPLQQTRTPLRTYKPQLEKQLAPMRYVPDAHGPMQQWRTDNSGKISQVRVRKEAMFPKALPDDERIVSLASTHNRKVACDLWIKNRMLRQIGLRAYMTTPQQRTITTAQGQSETVLVTSMWAINKKGQKVAPRAASPKFTQGIADEIHMLGAAGSAQGKAYETFIQAVGPKWIDLTGTLSNGYASSLFPILYRNFAPFRKAWKYTDISKWVNTYGVVEKKFRRELGGSEKIGTLSRRSNEGGLLSVKETPGFASAGLPHVLEHTGYIWISDVSDELPDYNEYIVSLPMNDALREEYTNIEKQAYAVFKERSKSAARARSSALQTCLTFATLPTAKYVIQDKKSQTVYFTHHGMADQRFPKEQQLIDDCLKNKKYGRKTLVYCSHTSTYDVPSRLYSFLKETGLRVLVLRSNTVAPLKRQQWIKDHTENIDVMITHPAMVNVGMNLLMFPSLIFYEIDYDVRKVMQASKRSFRIGQELPVEVCFYTYQHTLESKALELVARKRKAVAAIDGQFIEEGAFGWDSEDSIMDMLARTLMDEREDDVIDKISLDDMYSKRLIDADPPINILVEPYIVDPMQITDPTPFALPEPTQEPVLATSSIGKVMSFADFVQGNSSKRRKPKIDPNQSSLF